MSELTFRDRLTKWGLFEVLDIGPILLLEESLHPGTGRGRERECPYHDTPPRVPRDHVAPDRAWVHTCGGPRSSRPAPLPTVGVIFGVNV